VNGIDVLCFRNDPEEALDIFPAAGRSPRRQQHGRTGGDSETHGLGQRPFSAQSHDYRSDHRISGSDTAHRSNRNGREPLSVPSVRQ